MRYLITGSAGFIGYHTSKRLLEAGHSVIGMDSLNDYYSVQLKTDRNKQLLENPAYNFVQGELTDAALWKNLHARFGDVDAVVHLAAQAGVRNSIDRPGDYVKSNLAGFLEVLEFVRASPLTRLVFASSSSVYGDNAKIPFSTDDPIRHPISFYGATKVANEAMAYSYHHLFGIPMAGLRFFTVYGPWGRPDMAYYKFAMAIDRGIPIQVYSGGNMQRSFTYIDDAVDGIIGSLQLGPGFEILNIGNDTSVPLMHLIECLELSLGKKAILDFLPPQDGDMQATAADITDARKKLGFQPKLDLKEGVTEFVKWFRSYHPNHS